MGEIIEIEDDNDQLIEITDDGTTKGGDDEVEKEKVEGGNAITRFLNNETVNTYFNNFVDWTLDGITFFGKFLWVTSSVFMLIFVPMTRALILEEHLTKSHSYHQDEKIKQKIIVLEENQKKLSDQIEDLGEIPCVE
eukprot:TRINITY_DN1169_c0_g1_i1.p1 TRINITY_DN1169_c0_g1~~TRINITY_DN1169_c0_g1_i1.p1  ORF type:complete len:137 (-),score=61.94 TRINITY_DN1169_c0_g1_i1:34-444(-)